MLQSVNFKKSFFIEKSKKFETANFYMIECFCLIGLGKFVRFKKSMEVSFNFEIAVYLAWTLAIFFLIGVVRFYPAKWHNLEIISLENPKKEMFLALATVFVLIAISISTDNLLRPLKRNTSIGGLIHFLQILLVYSPIFAMLKWRKQSLKTCFLNFDKLPFKILLGIFISLIASLIFLTVRGSFSSYPQYLMTLGKGGPVAMFQTFMEGFGIGFLLYRLGAWIGITWSALLVAILFMAAHIPNYTGGNFNLSLPFAILMTIAHAGISALAIIGAWKTQDIIVFGFIHWFINRASDFTTI